MRGRRFCVGRADCGSRTGDESAASASATVPRRLSNDFYFELGTLSTSTGSAPEFSSAANASADSLLKFPLT